MVFSGIIKWRVVGTHFPIKDSQKVFGKKWLFHSFPYSQIAGSTDIPPTLAKYYLQCFEEARCEHLSTCQVTSREWQKAGRKAEGEAEMEKANQHELQPVSYKPDMFGAVRMFLLHQMRAATGAKAVTRGKSQWETPLSLPSLRSCYC